MKPRVNPLLAMVNATIPAQQYGTWFNTGFIQMTQNQPALQIASVPVLEHIVP